ncbi:hypothetical protein [Streptomyces virginiae]|uniref:hypothetical protein n=1 Tax=Streptomyces virginiae TaxID=1961 RepID=UPI00386D5794|nr:hypothetical protein OG253_41250 [Streptomyces virginiae]
MNGSNASAGVPATHSVALLPLLGSDEEVVAFLAGVADLDASNPADCLLGDGARLASGFRLEQFARAASGDAFCFVGEGGEERPVVYISLDGEAGPLAAGLPELVRLCLVAPWWRDAPGRTARELQAVGDQYREDIPDLDQRRDRAARALGLEPAELPSETAVLARLIELSRGPVAAACLVVGYEAEPLDSLFGVTPLSLTDHLSRPRPNRAVFSAQGRSGPGRPGAAKDHWTAPLARGPFGGAVVIRCVVSLPGVSGRVLGHMDGGPKRAKPAGLQGDRSRDDSSEWKAAKAAVTASRRRSDTRCGISGDPYVWIVHRSVIAKAFARWGHILLPCS